MAIMCQCGDDSRLADGCPCGVGMIVAQGELLMAIGCQCGVGYIVACVADGY